MVVANAKGDIPGLSKSHILDHSIVLPSVNQQHRIVAKIEELFSEIDKGVESLTTAREQLKVYRQAVLKHAFEGNLTANWRTENKTKLSSTVSQQGELEIARKKYYAKAVADWEQTLTEWQDGGSRGKRPPKPSSEEEVPPVNSAEVARLPVLPSQWTYTRLASIAQIGSGMSVSKEREVSNPISVPYLRVANVQRGRLDLEHLAQMRIERTQLPGLGLKKWDVLFNEGGDRDKLGRGWIWEDQVVPCITQNHVFRASLFFATEYTAKFLSYWGNTYGQVQ
jgi:type I restriction enzyme S subunit